MNSVCKEEESISGSYLLFLSMLGLICLQFGLIATLLKCAQHLWPILLSVPCSFFLIWGLKKSGLFFSYFLLALALPITARREDLFWPMLLSSSLALSYLLLFLGHKEARLLLQKREEKITSINEMNAVALATVARLEAALTRSQNEIGASVEKLKNALSAAETKSASLHSECEIQEQEKNTWRQRHDTLFEEMADHQRKEEIFLREIEEKNNQLARMKELQPIEKFSMDEQQDDSAEMKSFHALQAQYELLKSQFEEKSDVLHQTRKALFAMESEWLHLQKQNEENLYHFSEEDNRFSSSVYNLHEQCLQLEQEILFLEELISFLLSPKTPAASRKKRNKKEAQEDLFVMMQANQPSVSTS